MAQAASKPPVLPDGMYTILAVRDVTNVGDDNRLHEYIQVPFKTVWGDVGNVQILKDDFDAETAKSLVEAQVMHYATLHGYKP